MQCKMWVLYSSSFLRYVGRVYPHHWIAPGGGASLKLEASSCPGIILTCIMYRMLLLKYFIISAKICAAVLLSSHPGVGTSPFISSSACLYSHACLAGLVWRGGASRQDDPQQWSCTPAQPGAGCCCSGRGFTNSISFLPKHAGNLTKLYQPKCKA